MEWSGLKIKDFQLHVCMKSHSSQAHWRPSSFVSSRDVASRVVPVWCGWGLGQIILQATGALLPPVTVQYWWHWGKKSGRMGPAVDSPGGCPSVAQTWAVYSGEGVGWCQWHPNSHPLVGDVVSAAWEISPLASEGVIMWNYLRFPILLIEMAELIKYLCPKCHVYKIIISFPVVCTSLHEMKDKIVEKK